MKTSIVLMIALWANTTLLLSESMTFLASSINIWILVWVEFLLVAFYYFHQVSKAFEKVFDIEISGSDIFLTGHAKTLK